MEPVTALASIVSLLRIFKQERGERKKADHLAFVEWLNYHHHEELKDVIVNTAALRSAVDNILAADHALMLRKLYDIQTIVATLLSRVDEFRGISLAVAPDTQFSKQALSVLRQFMISGAETLLYATHEPGQSVLQPDNGEPLGISEPRFLNHDIEQLLAPGLLTVEHNSDGSRLLRVRRTAVRYLEATGGKVSH